MAQRAKIVDYGTEDAQGVRVTNNAAHVNITGSNVTYTTPTHTTLGVTAASQTALAANANRKYALFINDSANNIWLKIGATAVANQGIRLNAVGGSYEMKSSDGSLNTGAVTAISDVAGPSVLTVLEGV